MKKIFEYLVAKGEKILLKQLLPSKEQIREIHNGLFDFFLPYEGNDIQIKEAIEKGRNDNLNDLFKNTQIKWIIVFIYKPERLLKNKWITSYYKYVEKAPLPASSDMLSAKQALKTFFSDAGTTTFLSMSYDQKVMFLSVLINSRLNFYRRLGAGLRVYYMVHVYKGKTGNLIANIGSYKEDAFIPEEKIKCPEFKTSLVYNKHRQTIEGQVDYIVVGCGPSGCLVAAELHKAGKKVVIVESGSFFMPGTYDGRSGLRFYESKGFRTTNDGGVFVLNGSVVGGGATVNVDMAFEPTLPWISTRFDAWRDQNIISENVWSKEKMSDAHQSVFGRLETRTIPENEINTCNRIIKEGGKKHGLAPSVYKLNTYKPGESPFAKTDKKGPVENFILQPMTDKENPITLIPDAVVNDLIINEGQMEGISFETQKSDDLEGIISDPFNLGLPYHQKISIRAENVILAGGNLGTSVLLKKAKIDNPLIGKGFVMHPFMLVMGLFDQVIDNHLGTQSSIYIEDYMTTNYKIPKDDFLIEVASARPEIGAMLLPGNPKQVMALIKRYRYFGGVGILLIEDMQLINKVTINKIGQPEIYYKLSENDIARLKRGVAEGIKILFKGGAKKVIISTYEPLCGNILDDQGFNMIDSIDQADEIAAKLKINTNETILFAAHMMGGVKMSKTKEKGCIDDNYMVHGINNLYVVDSSIYPSSVGANPMQTIYTTAKIFIDKHLNSKKNCITT